MSYKKPGSSYYNVPKYFNNVVTSAIQGLFNHEFYLKRKKTSITKRDLSLN